MPRRREPLWWHLKNPFYRNLSACKTNYGTFIWWNTVCVWVTQSCPTFCHPMDYNSSPASSVCGILHARILEWVAISFFRGSSQSRDWTHVFCIASGFFTAKLAGIKVDYGIIASPHGYLLISLSPFLFLPSSLSNIPICLSPSLAHPTLFKSPYSLRHNYIEIRPVSNPTTASKHSREKYWMFL